MRQLKGEVKQQSQEQKVHLRDFLFFALYLITIRAHNSCPGERNKVSTLSAEQHIYIM